MADRIQITADHIAAFHEYMSEISGQTYEIGEYVTTHIAETDAYGSGLLSPLKDFIADNACEPFRDMLSEARTRMFEAQANLWRTGANFDRIDGEISPYFDLIPGNE